MSPQKLKNMSKDEIIHELTSRRARGTFHRWETEKLRDFLITLLEDPNLYYLYSYL